MHQPVAGIETEYGLLISGRTPHEQVEDAAQFVRCCPLKGFLGWDYRFESPRNDLRGFVLDHLAIDPIDRQFDTGRTALPDQDLKSDRVLANGGRFYNGGSFYIGYVGNGYNLVTVTDTGSVPCP